MSATKEVFLSAVQFAISTGKLCPPFGDELKASAQEQVEFMLDQDEGTPSVASDDEVKMELKAGLSNVFSSFVNTLSSLLSVSAHECKATEAQILQSLADLEWMCKVLPKMNLMKEFVSGWLGISNDVMRVIDDEKLSCLIWRLKAKLIKVTGKSLEAVGYGNVILPAACRVKLLKYWLPYIRKMKALLGVKEEEMLNEEQWEVIEGAIVSLVLALPSADQAEILLDWMKSAEDGYPDLSEAFEIWCYRSKSAKRRLASVSL